MRHVSRVKGLDLRVEVDGIVHLATTTHETTNPDRWTFLRDLSALEILDKHSLQLLHAFVMVFDEFRQLANVTANVDRGCRIRRVNALEDSANTLVRLMLFGYLIDHQGPSVERLYIFGGAEPLLAE